MMKHKVRGVIGGTNSVLSGRNERRKETHSGWDVFRQGSEPWIYKLRIRNLTHVAPVLKFRFGSGADADDDNKQRCSASFKGIACTSLIPNCSLVSQEICELWLVIY
jgi:hypothetical protein